MGKKYRSDALAAVHETALGLTEAGVMDKRTMKAFDEMCLTPVEELTAEQIRQIRLREKASQAVFARYLNVTTGLVSQWERRARNIHAAPRSNCSRWSLRRDCRPLREHLRRDDHEGHGAALSARILVAEIASVVSSSTIRSTV